MPNEEYNVRKYMATLAVGAVVGGIVVAWAAKAIPKMMSGMMQNMMASMGGESCSPAEV